MSEKFKPEFIEKLSRVVKHAAEKDRRPLFEKLTAKNAELLAEASKEKPRLYTNKEDSEKQLYVDDSIAGRLSEEFFADPTGWIESQSNISRPNEEMPEGGAIAELWGKPYDVSKVKEFELKVDGSTVPVVSKRIDSGQLSEVARARAAYEAGIPTPKVLAEIVDKGNIYAWFERLPGINLNGLINKFDLEGKKAVFDPGAGLSGLMWPLWSEAIGENIERDLSYVSDQVKIEIGDFLIENKFYDLLKEMDCVLYSMLVLKGVVRMSSIGDAEILSSAAEVRISSLGISKRGYFLDLVDRLLALPRKTDLTVDQGTFVEDTLLGLDSQYNALLDKKFELGDEVARMVQKDQLGFVVYEEKEKLAELCKDKGVEHKDFANRNLMMLWDFEKDKPLPIGPNDPKLYIIDWEEEKSSKKLN